MTFHHVWQKMHILACASLHMRLTMHHNVSRARMTYKKAIYGYLLNQHQTENNQTVLCLIQKLSVHPT